MGFVVIVEGDVEHRGKSYPSDQLIFRPELV